MHPETYIKQSINTESHTLSAIRIILTEDVLMEYKTLNINIFPDTPIMEIIKETIPNVMLSPLKFPTLNPQELEGHFQVFHCENKCNHFKKLPFFGTNFCNRCLGQAEMN